MFTPEEREAALELYDRLGSVPAVVAELGYPSERCLYGWIARRDGACTRPRAVRYPAQEKAAAARRVLSGESCAAVAADVGASASAVLRWRDAYAEGGIGALMAKGDVVAPGPRADAGALPDDAVELKRMVLELQLENDLMRQVVELVKKDPCVDPTRLSNREKAQVIDAMRGTYSLSCLASRLGIAASSYHYARAAAAAPDKWAEARAAVVEEFEGAGRSRGYRYVHRRLAERGIACGERKVRELMAEEGCVVVYLRRPKRWSSYAGEVSEAPPNLVERSFVSVNLSFADFTNEPHPFAPTHMRRSRQRHAPLPASRSGARSLVR